MNRGTRRNTSASDTSTGRAATILGLTGLALVYACNKARDKESPAITATSSGASAATISSAPATRPAVVDTAGERCRGTMTGAASGTFTCEAIALFFLPPYKDSGLRGNSEMTLMSSTQFQRGTPPPGVDLVTWASVFRGTLKPGTYTEKDLVHDNLEVASITLSGHKTLTGLKHAKLVVKGVSSEGVHEDTVTKRGPTRADRVVGELDLVIGNASGEVTIHATLN